MASVELVEGTYYYVDSYTTCLCDRSYCTGCTEIPTRQVIPEAPRDCVACGACGTVVPTFLSIREPRTRRQAEGQDTREGYTMKCTACGTAP